MSLAAQYEKDEITQYVEIEAQGEVVADAEKLFSRPVGDTKYDVWKVVTDQNEWWVITPLTNLYLLSDFPSVDQVFTVHLGIVEQLRARQHPSVDQEELDRAPRAWRIWEQAVEALEHAEEAEDFQSVGNRLRQTLLQLVTEVTAADWAIKLKDPPKRGDYKAWIRVIVDTICTGSSNARMRKHIISSAETTWDLVSWLVHAEDANRIDTQVALSSADHITALLLMLIVRFERGTPQRCPSCGSLRMASRYLSSRDQDGRYEEGRYVTICESCDWQNNGESES